MDLVHLDQVAVFETVRAYRGKIYFWAQHDKRFRQSAAGLAKTFPLTTSQFRRWIDFVLLSSSWTDAILRVSAHWTSKDSGELVAIVRPFKEYPSEWYEDGVSMRTTVSQRWTLKAQDSQLKTSQYVSGVLALLDRGEIPAHELMFLGPTGTVAEGSVSNLFLVRNRRLLTPSVSSGILSGVTRSLVIRAARAAGFEVRETLLTRHEFYTADECFMTNTSSEVLPVVELDGRKIAGGVPGPVSAELRKKFRSMMETERS